MTKKTDGNIYIKYIFIVLTITLPLLLLTGTVFSINTNTSSNYPFHVCHNVVGSGNVNCTTGDIESGYYNFTVVNTSAWNVSLPQWKLYPMEDSYTSSYPYIYCSVPPYICRNSSQWDLLTLFSGVYGRYYDNWIWMKFSSNDSKTGMTYCEDAWLCLNKTGETGITSSGHEFMVYYSHNQTWVEEELTWDTQPDWVNAMVSKVNITDTDGFYCWDVSDVYCDNIQDNATYMIRTPIKDFDTETRHLNFTVGYVGMGSRAWDTYTDSFNAIPLNTENRAYITNGSYIRTIWENKTITSTPIDEHYGFDCIDGTHFNDTSYFDFDIEGLALPTMFLNITNITVGTNYTITWKYRKHTTGTLPYMYLSCKNSTGDWQHIWSTAGSKTETLTHDIPTSCEGSDPIQLNWTLNKGDNTWTWFYGYNITDMNNSMTYCLNSTIKSRIKNTYIRVAPNYVDFVGSTVNNATLYVNVPVGCDNPSYINIYECREENMTPIMTWNSQPYCTLVDEALPVNMSLGWHTFNITSVVQRAAMSGGYQTSNISLRISYNSTNSYETCISTEDSGSNEPIVEIGYTYTTKNKIAIFASNNTTVVSSKPYLLANYTWSLNASSMLNMTNSTNNVIWNFRPMGQTETQWQYKICSDSGTSGPVDIYVSLVNITNSTNNTLTSLPSCVREFYHYSNSTNVLQESTANVTGNDSGRVLHNLGNGTCGYIWQNITFNNCTPGDWWTFDFMWEAKTDS